MAQNTKSNKSMKSNIEDSQWLYKSVFTSFSEPDEHVDTSMVEEKTICSGGDNREDFSSCKPNDFNLHTPFGPLVATGLDKNNISK